jgi:outer membrane biosynthesis protein TonB
MRSTIGMRTDGLPWPKVVALSLLLHLIFIMGLFGISRWNTNKRQQPKFISVELLVAASPPAPKHTPAQRPPSKTRSKQLKTKVTIPKVKRQAVSVAPRKMELPKPSAKRKISRPKPKEPEVPRRSAQYRRDSRGAGTQLAPSSGGLSSRELQYLSMLQQRIEENWRAYLPQQTGVVGEVEIELSANGVIQRIVFRKGYGLGQVDESIKRALKRVVLPPPPRSLVGRPLVLRFWSTEGP